MADDDREPGFIESLVSSSLWRSPDDPQWACCRCPDGPLSGSW